MELEGDPDSSTALTPSQASGDPDLLPRHCSTQIPPGKQVTQRVSGPQLCSFSLNQIL